MCGISGIFGHDWERSQLDVMVEVQNHRGPDGNAVYLDPAGRAGLGHNRLKIIDLSEAGRQPMVDCEGRYRIAFNGEIYNFLEQRRELEDIYDFRTRTDTEVLLAAFRQWGEACLHRFIGMFAFSIWDELSGTLFAARDRFGVKPLYYHHRSDGTLLLASEIKALLAAGVPAIPDTGVWASYLSRGLSDHSDRTFWEGIRSLPPGHFLKWREGRLEISCWFDPATEFDQAFDVRPAEEVMEEYQSLLMDSVRLRFRSDVPVGINLSGGLDSSTLLGIVRAVQGAESGIRAFTFVTGDPNYDELPWVRSMLAQTRYPSVVCRLEPGDVPGLAESVSAHQDEPFGGLPTLAYARLFEQARLEGVIVLLDGQGMDEQWAGYDYYRSAGPSDGVALVQGMNDKPTKPECLAPDFCAEALPFCPPAPFPDALRNLQYRDARYTKIPRALRFNDRISMRSSIELREPFLDHRLFMLALRQPPERKILNGTEKWLLRKITEKILPTKVVEAPKRALQTPQREWLRGPLRGWAAERIEEALAAFGGVWLQSDTVRTAWKQYWHGESDNSFYIWQWISLGLMTRDRFRFEMWRGSLSHAARPAPRAAAR